MKKYITLLISLILIFTVSCSDYLDVNHDPNVLEEIPDAKVLMPAAQVGLGNNLMGWDFGFGGAFWVQYWTQNYTASQFKTLAEYIEQYFSNSYQDLTAGVLADLKKIKVLNADSEDKGMYFVAETLSIFTWQIITDLWGDIPYSEALKGDEGIDSPKFDEGKDIYADLMNRIDALLAIDLTNATIDAKTDFYYGGDLAKWVKFANSLKLKLMLRLSETTEYNNATTLAFVQNGDFLNSSAKIKGSIWAVDGTKGKQHPMIEFQIGGANYRSTNVIASKSFLDYLETNNDPRLNTLFVPPAGGVHKSAFFGDFSSKADSDGNGTADDKEKYSTTLFADDMDLMIMTDWEVAFYIAEVYARASNLVKAKEYYDMGVKASLSQHGISDTDILNNYAEWVDGTQEQNIKQIAMQKWVANANYQHIESFIERNRLKYPSVNEIDIKANRTDAYLNFPVGDLTISVTGKGKLNGSLPQSVMYPPAVLTRNVNALPQKADLGVKVWWNKKVGK